jgi:pyruvate dehydrogenase E2 component (dihydrolipoamide acetyltransferase)
MCRLVRTAERHIDALNGSGLLPPPTLAPADGSPPSAAPANGAPPAPAGGGSPSGRGRAEVLRQTQRALDTWRALRDGAKTPSTVLPAEGSDLLRRLAASEAWERAIGAGGPPDGAAAPPAPAPAAAADDAAAPDAAPPEGKPATPRAAAAVAAAAGAAKRAAAGEGGAASPDAKRQHVA